MNHPAETNNCQPDCSAGPGAYAWCGLCVALVGSVAVGLIECAAACAVALKHYGDPNWPWALIAAAAGKAMVSHALIWCPLFGLLGLGMGWAMRKLARHAPEALMFALFVLLAGGLIAPIDLIVAERESPGRVLAVALVSLGIAVLGFWRLRRWTLRRGRRPAGRLCAALAGSALLVGAAGALALVRSPMFDPQDYAVAEVAARAKKPGYPHVLWIMLDTVRADHTNIHGYAKPTTPRLAEFAAGAVVFERAIANGIWTLPNHASIFSGRNLREHGADFRYPRLASSFQTVATRLSDYGYATAVFSNNPWVAPDTDMTRGFDTQRIVYHLRHINRSSIGWIIERLGWAPPFPWLDEDFGAALTNALIADWLTEQSAEDQPIFLFVNYMDAHLPYRVPRRYRSYFLSDEQVARSYALSLSAYGRIVDAVDRRFNFEDQSFFAAADREVLKGQYDAGIRYLDDRASELLAMFAQRGLLENSLVLITSDHGEYLDQHGQWAHRMQVYQDLLGVVVVVRPPGLSTGRREPVPAQLSDLFETVLSATVGLEGVETAWHSQDLLAVDVASNGSRIVVSEYGGDAKHNLKRIRERNDPELNRRAIPQVAAQDGRYKLIVSADGRQELFDIISDPREESDLVHSHPEQATQLGRFLAKWHARSEPLKAPAPGTTPDLDPDVIRALKSLGYLGDD